MDLFSSGCLPFNSSFYYLLLQFYYLFTTLRPQTYWLEAVMSFQARLMPPSSVAGKGVVSSLAAP